MPSTRGGATCKGAGINEGLALLDHAWVVHLDADVWLPPQTRLLLHNANLDRSMLYGIDRFCVKGYAQWDRFLEKPILQHECDAYVHMNAFPLGTRVTSKDGGGYIPIGFFQMWCPSASGRFTYPEAHSDAGRGDRSSPNNGRGQSAHLSPRWWAITWKAQTPPCWPIGPAAPRRPLPTTAVRNEPYRSPGTATVSYQLWWQNPYSSHSGGYWCPAIAG